MPETPGQPRSSRYAWWALLLGMPILTAIACLWQWASLLDTSAYDTAQRSWPRPPPEDVVIVAIDEPSLKAIGRWPWKRAIHAEAIRRIDHAGAKSILLNLLLSEADPDPGQDQQLANAMKHSGKVVLLVGRLAQGPGQGQALPPIAPLAEAAALLAHADALLDDDGTLRRAQLWSGGDSVRTGPVLPHPALALLQAAGEVPAWLATPDTDARNSHGPQRIPFVGPPGHVRHVSYAAVLRGELAPDTFRGRHVLIGATAFGLGDTFQTPVSREGQGMSGAEVTAQWLGSLQRGRHLRSLPDAWNAALSALVVLGLLVCYPRLAPRRALLLALGTGALAVGVSWALMAIDLWWPPFGLALGALLSYPAWSWLKLETTARALEAELQRLSRDPGVQTSWPASVLDAPRTDFMSQRTDALSQAGAQLRQARQVLARTLAALPDAVFVIDSQHRITQANQQAGLMSEVAPASALLGRPLQEVLTAWAPSEAPNWAMVLSRAVQSGQVQHTEASHPGGRQLLVSVVAVDGGLASSEAEIIVCATDVTALRQAELQRAELLGFIAHDIRAPQASLVSLVELRRLGGKLSNEETLAHVESMARHTLELCEELLQVMRAETRPASLAPGDLVKLANSAIAHMQMLAKGRDIRVHADWDEGTTMPAVYDDYLLHRALCNLLSNAIKFSPPKGLVTVALEEQPGYRVLSVKDQGPGIPESELGRLFKRYERVEQGRPSKLAAGIGLGLVFIDTVARRHGGHVKVLNRPGEGACFELWLPTLEQPTMPEHGTAIDGA